MPRVALFHTAAKHTVHAVLIHNSSCRLVAAARTTSRGLIRVIEGDGYAAELKSLRERGYEPRECKCVRKKNP